MKTSIFLLVSSLCLGVFSCASLGELGTSKGTIGEGAELHYTVIAPNGTYPFNLVVNDFSSSALSFDWEMNSESSGHVFMKEKEINTAVSLHNYFASGHTILEDKTSVWISKLLFAQLKNKEKVKIDIGSSVGEFEYVRKETYSFKDENGSTQSMPVFVVSDSQTNYEIWIHDHPTNRLIVKMKIDFQINLDVIKAI